MRAKGPRESGALDTELPVGRPAGPPQGPGLLVTERPERSDVVIWSSHDVGVLLLSGLSAALCFLNWWSLDFGPIRGTAAGVDHALGKVACAGFVLSGLAVLWHRLPIPSIDAAGRFGPVAGLGLGFVMVLGFIFSEPFPVLHLGNHTAGETLWLWATFLTSLTGLQLAHRRRDE